MDDVDLYVGGLSETPVGGIAMSTKKTKDRLAGIWLPAQTRNIKQKCKSMHWPKTKNEHILNLTQESECSMGRQQYECFQNLQFHISSIPQQSTSICFVSQEKLPSKETAKKSSQLLPFCHIGNSKLGFFYSPQVVSSDLPLLVSSVVRYYPSFGIV